MDQFSEQLYELDNRLRKGLSLGKDLKHEQKLRDSSTQSFRKVSDNQGDILDLKAELVSQKNKLFICEQQKLEDATLYKQTIQRLEVSLRDETKRRVDEADIKQKKIEEFEQEIESLLNEYAIENE